jgi:cyanophycinase
MTSVTVLHFRLPMTYPRRNAGCSPVRHLWIVVVLWAGSLIAADHPYQYFRAGNAGDIQAKTQAGFALVGGGDDLDVAFKYMCDRAGGGDFLVLRAGGDDDYNPYIQGLCKLNSVGTLILTSREAANDPFVADTIRHAEAIFIAGGDQAHYINWWMDTPVQQALNDALQKGVPMGGTSAGLAVQGEFVYSAQGDAPDDADLNSSQTLANPFHPRVTIVHALLSNPLLKNVITDTHFAARNRMGRTLVFMARILQGGRAKQIRDIAVDERTSVLLDPDGRTTVVGAGHAYFLQSTQAPEVCKPDTPLTLRGIAVHSLAAGEHFDVAHWSTTEGTSYTLSVESGVIKSTLAGGAIYTQKTE